MRRSSLCSGGNKRRSATAEKVEACRLQTALTVAVVAVGVEEVDEVGEEALMASEGPEVVGGVVLLERKARDRLRLHRLGHNYALFLGFLVLFRCSALQGLTTIT